MKTDHDLTHLDLFSGIGGFALAAQWAGFRTIGFSEIEPYACRVLEKNFRGVPNLGDIRKMDCSSIGDVRLLTGGYPCQPFSSAGKRQGAADDRHLWPAMFGVIKAVRPTWVVAENVAGHISMGLDEVLSDLESIDYAAQPIVIPACAVGAWHRRDRVWIIARAGSAESQQQQGEWREKPRGVCADVADANSQGSQGRNRSLLRERRRERTIGESDSQIAVSGNSTISGLPDWAGGSVGQPGPLTEFERPSGREVERDFRGIPYGVSKRVHRLKGLGNSIVPQVAYQILKAIAEIENETV